MKLMSQHWQMTVDIDQVDVTSPFPSPHHHWRFTDAEGHEHRWDHGYPTLTRVVDAEHWCDGNEGIARHDPHMATDEAHYECAICGEVIEPEMDPPYTPKTIPGHITYTLTGHRSNGAKVTAWLTEDEAAAVTPDATDDTIAALLDAIPDERCSLIEYSS
jgi:hypothetical protein